MQCRRSNEVIYRKQDKYDEYLSGDRVCGSVRTIARPLSNGSVMWSVCSAVGVYVSTTVTDYYMQPTGVSAPIKLLPHSGPADAIFSHANTTTGEERWQSGRLEEPCDDVTQVNSSPSVSIKRCSDAAQLNNR